MAETTLSPYGIGLIDSHCHLDYMKKVSVEETLQKSKEVGIDKLVTISVEPDNLAVTLELAKKYENVFCSQGIHPHDVKLITEEILQTVKENAQNNPAEVLAIGEIGLDYHYDHSPRKLQQEMFERQLQLADELDLPVVIHSREAEDDTISVLKNFTETLKRKGVFHSFSSSLPLAEFALEQGFYLGFNGMITFSQADNVREALKITPPNRLLIETDAPFLAPKPYRGRENGPFYLGHILEKAADVMGLNTIDLAEQIYKNWHDLFVRD